MKLTLRQSFLVLVAIVAAAASGALVQNACAAQPHMHAALDDLRAARHQLETAIPDKGGHRERAIQIIDNAIGEVEAGIQAGA